MGLRRVICYLLLIGLTICALPAFLIASNYLLSKALVYFTPADDSIDETAAPQRNMGQEVFKALYEQGGKTNPDGLPEIPGMGVVPQAGMDDTGPGDTRDDPTCKKDGTCYTGKKIKKEKPYNYLKAKIHPDYEHLIKEYPFQPVVTDKGKYVNIILVRAPFRTKEQEMMYVEYRDQILFLGMCSFEDYPLPPANPFSYSFPRETFIGLFPGWLHMFRHPIEIFPRHVKTLLMSQSDFALPEVGSAVKLRQVEKKWDFTFSGSDQDVAQDCKGWSSFAKNWTFVKKALKVMCKEYKMTGVLVATKDKKNETACSIPKSCKGKILQTPYIPQEQYFEYLQQGKFAFIPQVHDASPRVTTQALVHDVPLLMNKNIMGGWKYVNDKTGEFFNDMSDFRESLERIMKNIRRDTYTPRDYVLKNFGDEISGKKFKNWIEKHFKDRVKLPKGTKLLLPTGA